MFYSLSINNKMCSTQLLKTYKTFIIYNKMLKVMSKIPINSQSLEIISQ